jgi:hypothetical protein
MDNPHSNVSTQINSLDGNGLFSDEVFDVIEHLVENKRFEEVESILLKLKEQADSMS